MILAQTEDQYPFATVYDQEKAFYTFRQESLTSAQWYERFNTKIDVGEAIGVSRHHKVLLEYCANEHAAGKAFADLTDAEQVIVRADAEERYVSYAFLRQSGSQHANLKEDLQNGFTTGDNRYPKTRQETLHLLDKYSKKVVAKTGDSEGSSFAQKEADKRDYWKDTTCYKCGKKGHIASGCDPSKAKKKANKTKDAGKDTDNKSVSSNAESVRKLGKELKKEIKKSFATVNTQLDKLQEGADESDMSDSESEDDYSHFQLCQEVHFTQFENDFEPGIAKLFKQTHATKKIKLDLTKVILLDSQSTMDLMYNRSMVSKTFKSSSTMRLKSNGGTMTVDRKALLPGYN